MNAMQTHRSSVDDLLAESIFYRHSHVTCHASRRQCNIPSLPRESAAMLMPRAPTATRCVVRLAAAVRAAANTQSVCQQSPFNAAISCCFVTYWETRALARLVQLRAWSWAARGRQTWPRADARTLHKQPISRAPMQHRERDVRSCSCIWWTAIVSPMISWQIRKKKTEVGGGPGESIAIACLCCCLAKVMSFAHDRP